MSDRINLQGNNNAIGEMIAGDKIVNNIQNIVQRALTAVEEAHQAHSLEAQALAAGVEKLAAALQESALAPQAKGNPYRGLGYYRLRDYALFAGRTQAIGDVLAQMDVSTLTVLHGDAGVGKTSLLRAGVQPALIQRGDFPVYLYPYNLDPALTLKRAFIADLSRTPLLAKAPLQEFLRQVSEVLGSGTGIFIFVDQFEDFFSQRPEAEQLAFARELADCLNDPALNVHWLLSVRSESFGQLSRLRPTIPNPYENEVQLKPLTRAEAEQAVLQPARRMSVPLERDLVRQIIADLGGETIPTTQLQLVCTALYEEVQRGGDLPDNAPQPRRAAADRRAARALSALAGDSADAPRAITRDLYDKLNGASGILNSHVERVLKYNLTPEQRPIAQRVLGALVSSEGKRATRSRNAILRDLNSTGQPVSLQQLNNTIDQLVISRLIVTRDAQADTPADPQTTTSFISYQIAHDFLLQQVQLDSEAQTRKSMQELIDREVKTYEKFGTLLSDTKLAIILPRKDSLVLNDKAKQLIQKSETSVRRRQRLVAGSVGLVITLVIAALASGGLAFSAQQSLAQARGTQAAAELQAAQARAAQRAAYADVLSAELTQTAVESERIKTEATAQAVATRAAQQQSTAQAQLQSAEKRLSEQAAAFEKLFRNNGLVTVENDPTDMLFDARTGQLWVASGTSLQAIDPATGVLGARIALAQPAQALAQEGDRTWVIQRGQNAIFAYDLLSGQQLLSITLPLRPSLAAFDGRRLWVASASDNALVVVNPLTTDMSEVIAVGNQPRAMAWDGRLMWVANRNSDNLQAIDPLFFNVALTVPVGSRPSTLAWDATRGWLWVGNYNDQRAVQAIDPQTQTVVDEIGATRPGETTSRLRRPGSLLVEGDTLWIANESNSSVAAYNINGQNLGAPINTGRVPRALTLAGGRLWVINQSDNTVQAIDPTAGQLEETVVTGAQPRALASDGATVWVANASNDEIVGVDIATRAIIRRIATGKGPRGVALDNAGGVWVTNSDDGTVSVFNARTGQARAFNIKVGPSPREATWDAENQRVWFVNNGSNTVQWVDATTFNPGLPIPVGNAPFNLLVAASYVWVASTNPETRGGQIDVVDPASNTTIASIPVGNGPGGLAFDGERIWVANYNDRTVQAINLRNCVRDLTTCTAETPLVTNLGPSGLAFGGGRVWVVNFDDNTVQTINPVDNTVGTPILVGSGPIRTIFDGKRLWFVNRDDNTLQSILVIP